MNKRIAVLLNNPIANDYRVIKMIRTLSEKATIDLFYIDGSPHVDSLHFNESVNLYSFNHKVSIKTKLLRHSFFGYEFNFFIREVLNRNKAYDIIWSNDLPTLRPAGIIASKLNAKLVYDSHEIYNETLNQFFPLRTSKLKKAVFSIMLLFMRKHGKTLESKWLRRTDAFITVNESLLDYFKNTCPSLNGNVIMNLPYTSEVLTKKNLKTIANWSNESIVFLYQGVLNEGRGLHLMVSNFHLTSDKNKLFILGDGPLKLDLQNTVRDLNCEDRIFFHPKVSLDELPSYTAGADIGMNLLEDLNLSKKLASPNKLFEYIHAGIPMLCSSTIENQKILNRFNLGVSIRNTPEDLVSGVNEISISYERYLSTSTFQKAKQFYSWERQAPLILKIINDLLAKA